MEAYFPPQYQTGGSNHLNDWMDPTYFDHSSMGHTVLPSYQQDHFDASTYIQPNMLDWADKSSKYTLPTAYQSNRDASISTTRSITPGLSDDGECFPNTDSTPQTPDDESRSPNQNNASASVAQPEEPVKRKRGRPRINRAETDTSETKIKSRVSKRLPHNQVERKYREGLNAELERLRLAIPTLPYRDTHALNGPPKPSKATVLASAIDYIHQMEAERERLSRENDALRSGRGMAPPAVGAAYRQRTWG